MLAYSEFDVPKGVVRQTIADVATSKKSAPAGFPQTDHRFGQHLVTDYKTDPLARFVEVLGPEHPALVSSLARINTRVRGATWLVYNDVAGEVVSAQGYALGLFEMVVSPLGLTKVDRAGRITDEIEVVRHVPFGRPRDGDSYARTSWSRWTQHQFDDQDRHEWTRVYHAIPAHGAGTAARNYDQTRFGYDGLYRRDVVVSPGGTVGRRADARWPWNARWIRSRRRRGAGCRRQRNRIGSEATISTVRQSQRPFKWYSSGARTAAFPPRPIAVTVPRATYEKGPAIEVLCDSDTEIPRSRRSAGRTSASTTTAASSHKVGTRARLLPAALVESRGTDAMVCGQCTSKCRIA